MKSVTIVGIGMGAETITAEGLRAVERAQALLGAPRVLGAFPREDRPVYPAYAPDKVREIVEKSGLERFAVLVSGDTGFFSAAEGLAFALAAYDIRLIPGIPSIAYFFARLKRPWQEAAILSCHGRAANFTDAVRRNRLTFALTGGNVDALARSLADAGLGGLAATVGEKLGTEGERIFTLPVGELARTPVGKLAVLLVENPDADARVRFGIPDEAFLRGDAPMTKAEVRAVSMSRLAPDPGAICCDIGAGTGSVTVEMALAAYAGHVYAVDQKEEAVSLIAENCRRFHIGNVTPILGGAPEALEELPPLDAAFIGGSGGAMAGIFEAILSKNPSARVVVNAVALETLNAALAAFKAHGIAPEIIQLGAARAKNAGGLNMMLAQNPVFILSGGGKS
ncbi:MAG: precorrin-6y C5,15-methyltransferase (decarboxylating) subunit CbiE [Christensenellaceae bacterium]|nr:precorrin-6y C5,15-methyltransferase (decarboxylating) subunit CbiE [Christensenellaceae bacterium]MEA5068475.1 precorrin-6y C5,15-methyltransferase (decarboxylating) subunit CbiE [Christensenellaceae bacterium]